MAQPPVDITELLIDWNAGNPEALEKLTPAVYDELRRLARSALMNERADHTLSATALVHEAYLRLVDQRKAAWENRVHFFGASSRIMRRILVDHAREKTREKRGGGSIVRVDLPEDIAAVALSPHADLAALDDAMSALAQFDERKSRVVEMKFFGGMTIPEIAQALAISEATVERDWKMARAWLIKRMQE